MSEKEKVNAYLKAIEDYVIGPVHQGSVGEHCVASLLLIFAAIDGLARLTDLNPNSNVGGSFRW